MQAYAIAVTEDNVRGVIRSEAGRGFSLEHALQWLEEHEEGWFLRDDESSLDCHFFEPEVFVVMYAFMRHDENDLFRYVVRI